MPLKDISDWDIRPFSFWDNLKWKLLPGRCALCGKWKLWGRSPHRKCEDYEQYQLDGR